MMSRLPVILGVLVLATAGARPVLAGRCNPGAGLGGAPLCACPDYEQLLPHDDEIRKCPTGWTAVVYDLDQPFPGDDGTTSHWAITGDTSSCPNYKGDIPIHGQFAGCWSPPDAYGCRKFKTPFEAQCYKMDAVPLGGSCDSSCADVKTGMLTIGNAGSGMFRVCPPIDPAKSCRGVAASGEERFRFQTGGWCLTGGCETDSPDVPADSCSNGWGATYFGFGFKVQPGWYDWQTGTFKVDTNQRRAVCGKVRDCLGPKVRGVVTTVGTPAKSTVFGKPPCIPGTKPGDPCNAPDCIP